MSTDREIMTAWQRLLQEAAAKAGESDPLPLFGADGLGGHETQAAILAFQARQKLPPSGEFDEATRAALNPPQQRAQAPSFMESVQMFSSIVHLALSILPGLPDDVSKIAAAVAAFGKDATGPNALAAELRDAARFARILADEADKAANGLDPSGSAQPQNPIVGK